MRVLVIDSYKQDVYEKDVPNSLEGVQSVVHGPIEFAWQFKNGDILYVNGNGEGCFDARFGIGESNTAAGFGVVVGSFGPENSQRPAVTTRDSLASLVRFSVPRISGPPAVMFSVGDPSGIPPMGAGPDGGSTIKIGGAALPQGIMLFCELPDPTPDEINIIGTGRVEVAFEREGNAAITTWCVTRESDGRRLFLEAQFHIGFEDEGFRYLLPRENPGHGRTAFILLQDQTAICRATRTPEISPHVCDAIEAAVIEQAIEAATDSSFRNKYGASMERYFARRNTPEAGFARARIKG
jgi:hypothetical protein